MIQHYSEIQGWFGYEKHFDKVIDTLYERQGRKLNIVEIGSWLGRSSFYLTEKHSEKANIFIVDTWLGSQSEINTSHTFAKENNIHTLFMRNMAKLYGKFTPIRAKSVEAADIFDANSLDYVFIDGEHTYEAVQADIYAWFPKIVKNGILAGHDYNWEGVAKAVNETFKDNFTEEGEYVWMVDCAKSK